MAQKARLRAIERFTSSDSAIMIATDVAARGLDIPGVQLVIHYHLPRTADMYVHRSGRTARASQKGSSIIICAPEEVMGVKRLVAKVHAQTGNTPSSSKYSIRSLDLDRRVISRLKPRATLAKKLADVGISKEKGNASDQIFQEAAADLGIEYDSEEFEGTGGGRSGRGNARKKKEREERSVGKEQMSAWKAELKALLATRVNVGVSERYLTGGTVDVDALLAGRGGDFLGSVDLLELEG
jgi:ATP-dependent RNA helicase DDX24/MAK5